MRGQSRNLLALLVLFVPLGLSSVEPEMCKAPPDVYIGTPVCLSGRQGGELRLKEHATQGTGIFVDSGQSLISSAGSSVAMGDMDGDGDLDAFVGNFKQANEVWWNDGSGVFSNGWQGLGNAQSEDVALGDLDGDDDLDAFVANGYGAQANKVWLNDGAGNFSDSGQNLGGSDSKAVALGDLDGDADLDAFVGNWNSPNRVWLNDGAGRFTDSGQSLGGSADSWGVALGDLDEDDDLDAFVGNQDEPSQVWQNDGTGVFTDSGQRLGDAATTGVALGDLDNDGDLDAFMAVAWNQPNEVWLNDGAGSFTDSGQRLGSLDSSDVALGDVDGDGDLDAVVANGSFVQPNKAWLNDGAGNFSDSGRNWGRSDSLDLALGDVDGDGDLDVFVVNGYTQANTVWLNEEQVVADFTGSPTSGSSPLTVTFTDQSTGSITSWSWAFGDGEGSTAPNPSHTYDAAGDYTVSLTVNGPAGSDTETKTDYIHVSDSYEPDDTCAQAKPIATDGTAQSHTFHRYADKDWVTFDATTGTTYILQTSNVGPDANTILELYDACDEPPVLEDGNPFGSTAQIIWTAPADGAYYLKVYNHDPDQFGEDATYDLSVRVQPTGGAAIIVAGHDDGYCLQSHIYHCTDQAYDVFADGGIPVDNVYYLTPDDANPDRDADATSANLQAAIESWAADRVRPGVPLYLYLMDHGGLDTFSINGSADTVSPADLDTWLTTLEQTTGADTINVFIEACRSGSFIDGWQEVAGPGRVVVASTSRDYNAYASAQGAYFSDAFFSAVGESKDLCQSFRDGESAVRATGLRQEPWIDGDGDGVPNEPGDCELAQRRGLAAFFGDRPPVIDVITAPARIEGYAATIKARVRDDIAVDEVWAVIYPPSFEEPAPTDTMPELDLTSIKLFDFDGDDEYSGTYGGFTEMGEYHIVVYAEDDEGDQATPKVANLRRGWEVYLPMVMKDS